VADGKVVIDVILDDGQVVKGVADIDGSLKGIGQTGKRAAVGVGKIVSALGLVALAKKGIDLVRNSLDGAIDRYDTLNNFPRVMQQIGFDAEQSEKAIQRLSDGVQGLPTRLDAVASTAQNIAVMTGDLEGAVETTLALNNAFLASGASSADAERGLQQYVQMLAKGEVDLQSWRTLQETMGVALNQTAEAFGFAGASAQNDLYDALKSGEVTFDEFNAKLVELSEAQGGFADMAREASGGIKTAWTNLRTWIVTGVADIMGAIDEALGGVGGMENLINSLKPVIQGFFGSIAEAIPRVVENVREFKERIEEWLPSMDEIKSAFGPFIESFQTSFQNLLDSVGPIWESLKTLFKSLEPILMILGAAWSVLYSISLGTLSGIISAIGPFINAVINAVDFVVNIFNAVIALLTGDFSAAWEYWNKAGQSAVDLFINLWETVKNFVMSFVETIIGFFQGLYDTLVGNSIIPDMVNAIIDWIANMGKWAKDKVRDMILGVIKFFLEMHLKSIQKVQDMLKSVRDKFNDIKKAVQERMENVRDTVEDLWGKAQDFLANIDLFQIGKDIIQGLINGIGSMASAVWEKAKSIATGIGDTIKRALGVSSPSKLAIWIMEMVGEGLEIGGDRALPGIKKTAQKMGQTATPVPEIVKLRGIKPPLGNLMPTASFATASGSASAGSPIFSRAMDNKQPAVIKVLIGGQVFEAFVEDITKIQERQEERFLAFRG